MPATARDYLVDRFRTDAAALRLRADTLHATRGAPTPGPDAATSRRMATACDAVVTMIDAIPAVPEVSAMMAALMALVPLLEQHAANESSTPAVRAVYVGAATRIREIHAAEARAHASTDETHDAGDDDPDLDPDEDA